MHSLHISCISAISRMALQILRSLYMTVYLYVLWLMKHERLLRDLQCFVQVEFYLGFWYFESAWGSTWWMSINACLLLVILKACLNTSRRQVNWTYNAKSIYLLLQRSVGRRKKEIDIIAKIRENFPWKNRKNFCINKTHRKVTLGRLNTW